MDGSRNITLMTQESEVLSATWYDSSERIEALRDEFAAAGELYSWCSSGRTNWLERRLASSDVLCLVLLDRDRGEWIDLLNDSREG